MQTSLKESARENSIRPMPIVIALESAPLPFHPQGESSAAMSRQEDPMAILHDAIIGSLWGDG
jgi:hypothetical protein